MVRGPQIACAIVLATASAAAADPPCKPSASLQGESSIVAALEPVLQQRGVEVHAVAAAPAFVASCRRVTVEVALDDGRILVHVTDPEGRQLSRSAEDTEAAATVIESWARGDLVEPLLAARGVLEVGPVPGARATTSRPRERPAFAIGGGPELGVSGDGALWSGARVYGCGRLAGLCAGGLLRVAKDLEQRGDTAELGTARYAIGLAATLEWPIGRGRFAVAPGIGLGLTSVTASLAAEDEVEQASAVFGRAAVGAGLAIADAWSLRADLAIELAPFARERLGENDGIDRQLAASPMVQTWFGIAIAYGGP